MWQFRALYIYIIFIFIHKSVVFIFLDAQFFSYKQSTRICCLSDYLSPTCWISVTSVTSAPPVRCWSSAAGTLALTWLFHWFLYSHRGHCWFKMMNTPLVTFSTFTVESHNGQLQLNSCRRRFSFTTYFPFICRSAALKAIWMKY